MPGKRQWGTQVAKAGLLLALLVTGLMGWLEALRADTDCNGVLDANGELPSCQWIGWSLGGIGVIIAAGSLGLVGEGRRHPRASLLGGLIALTAAWAVILFMVSRRTF